MIRTAEKYLAALVTFFTVTASLPAVSLGFCDDFSHGSAQWVPKGGVWSVANGQYIGGGDFPRGVVGDSVTLVKGFQAVDLRLQVDMTSWVRVDKGVVLRFQDPSNYILIDFRAWSNGFNDICVSELVAGKEHSYACTRNPVMDCGARALHVQVDLIGQHLSVSVWDQWGNGGLALEGTFPFCKGCKGQYCTGQAGLWVIDDGYLGKIPPYYDCIQRLSPPDAQRGNGITEFDNFCVAARPVRLPR